MHKHKKAPTAPAPTPAYAEERPEMEQVTMPTSQPRFPTPSPLTAASAAALAAAAFFAASAAPALPPGAPLLMVTRITPAASTGMDAHCTQQQQHTAGFNRS